MGMVMVMRVVDDALLYSQWRKESQHRRAGNENATTSTFTIRIRAESQKIGSIDQKREAGAKKKRKKKS